MAVKSERIEFQGHQGRLAARLDQPFGEIKAYALFAHCFTCTKDILAAGKIASRLADRGIATLRFDFTGLGASDGEFANTNFTSNVEDLVHAANWLRETHQAPALIIGHSLGGAAVLKAAPQIPEVKAVTTIGAPYDPGHVSHNFGEKISIIEQEGEAEVLLAGRPFRIQKQFLDDVRSSSIEDDVTGLKRALLVLHAPLDNIVGIENATRIFTAAKHPKSFVTLDDGDHLLSKPEDAEYAADVIASWSARYLKMDQYPRPKSRLKPNEKDTLVIERGDGKFTQVIETSGHSLVADEPESYGGNNRGPTPYDLLLSALGACTSMTIRIYAQHKKIKLDQVAVKLSHSKIHAEDCADCETESGKVDFIEREIELKGDFDEEARQKMLQIADRCPVHRTLHNEVKISSKLAD